MTYTIEPNNYVGPDESKLIRLFGRYLSLLIKPIIFNWSMNQEDSIKDQLNGGIRYIDLRVATKRSDHRVYFLHGLYGAEITQPLVEVKDWLDTHPGEIIIMDFQHFYKFTDQHHQSLIEHLRHLFRGKMCPLQNSLEYITLQWLYRQRYQLFVVYRDISARNYLDLWPSGAWPTPWPNTVNSTELIDFLNEGLKKRVPLAGYVSQCLLTPDGTYVMKHICGNLHRDLCPKCRGVTIPWIEENSPGSGGMNIVITDFVSLDNFLFSKSVIQRNVQLLAL